MSGSGLGYKRRDTPLPKLEGIHDSNTHLLVREMYPLIEAMFQSRFFLFKRGSIVKKLISQFFISEKGVTSIEYALIASLIFVAIVVAVSRLGTDVQNMYQLIVSSLP